MALTRDFKQTVLARAKRDPKFRQALFTEAINAYLTGDIATGKAMLRDLINATIGFEQLALEVKKPSKSLHRMLAPGGNQTPRTSSASLAHCKGRQTCGCWLAHTSRLSLATRRSSSPRPPRW